VIDGLTMSHLTWDDLLDDYEDTLDAYNDALDRGQSLTAESVDTASLPIDTPTEQHRERFNELIREAADVSARLRVAMEANEAQRNIDRLRVDAHREYASSSKLRHRPQPLLIA